MAGLLTLINQEGQSATGLQDEGLEQAGDLKIRNIRAHSENEGALYNLAGRAVSAGITTAKDYSAFKKAQDAGLDTSKLAGVGSDGSFGGVHDFAANLVNPYSKYSSLTRVARGQTAPAADVPDDTPLPSDGGSVTAAPPPSAPAAGQISTLHNENAPIAGYVANALFGNQ